MTIKKLSKNQFQVIANIKCDDGKYHTFRKIYNTQHEAKENYDADVEDFKYRINKKENIKVIETSDNNSIFSVCDEFLQNYELKNRASSTIRLKSIINLRIYPYFSQHTKVDYIFTETNMFKWKKWLIDDLKLSGEAVNTTLNIMKRIIDRAVRRCILQNPNEALKSTLQLDTVRVEKNTIEKAGDYWTVEEFKQFISTFEDSDVYKLVFETFFFTGMRMGELCGLQWKNIDFNKSTIIVDHQANNKLGLGKSILTPPKTKNGYRVIDIHKSLLSRLNDLKSSISNVIEDDFVFFGTKPGSPTTITRHFDNHIKLSGVKKIRIHDLRHSQSVMLSHLDYKISETYFIERMGHANISEDIFTYGHATQEDKKAVINHLEKISSIIER